MQQPIGDFIRQCRRQQNITQTELGGTRFSKSYVSAVERNKISSSVEALRYFAEQLGQPADYFISLLQQVGNPRNVSVFPSLDEHKQDETLTLLDILLESTELYSFPTLNDIPTMSPEVIAALPMHKQSRYYFLRGLMAQQKQDAATALEDFEYALALAPTKHRSLILDELGLSYYRSHLYETALHYHQRALNLLQNEPASEVNTGLRFKVELHCGDDCRAVGGYQQACQHYEHARQVLNAKHDMKTAGLLYINLGYCTYLTIFQKTSLLKPLKERGSFEEMDREFQRAVSYLVQGRSVYQVSGDSLGESLARLTLARVLLDYTVRQKQLVVDKAGITASRAVIANSNTSLTEAEEQCRQVLLNWQNPDHALVGSPEVDTSVFIALAYLIRILVRRAVIARLEGFHNTAHREREVALYLSQQVLDALAEKSLPWALIHNMVVLQAENITFQPSSLPRLPVFGDNSNSIPRSAMSLVEVYFAVGELTEELSMSATSASFCQDCYRWADQSFRHALDAARLLEKQDPSYVMEAYRRFASVLEERVLHNSEQAGASTRLLSNILEEALNLSVYPMLT